MSLEVKDTMLGVQEDWKTAQEKFANDTSQINERIGAALSKMEATLSSLANYDDRMVVVEGQVEELVGAGGRVEELERKVEGLEQELAVIKTRPKPFDYERTLVLTNVAYSPTETKEERLEIATRILVEGFNIQHKDLPPIIDTARLPHNKEKQIASLSTDRPYHPGIKVEFTDNHTRNLVLNQAKNLRRNENYKNVEARESMSVGDRRAVDCLKHITYTLRRQGIAGLNHILPNGRMREWEDRTPLMAPSTTQEPSASYLPASASASFRGRARGRGGRGGFSRPLVNISKIPKPGVTST